MRRARGSGDRMTDSARDHVATISTGRVYAPFGKALRALFPPGTPHVRIVEFFHNRAPWHSIDNWQRGLAGPPAWAIERIRSHAEAIAAIARQTKIGPGQKAGTENLRKWHARKKD